MKNRRIYPQSLTETEADLEGRLSPEQEKFFDFAKRHLLYPDETRITFNGQLLSLKDGERLTIRKVLDVMQRQFKYDLYHLDGHPQIIRLIAFGEPKIGRGFARLFPRANIYGEFENEGYETVQEVWDYDKEGKLIFLDGKAKRNRKRRERDIQKHQKLVQEYLRFGENRYSKHCNFAERIYGALDELVNNRNVRGMAVACTCATLMAEIDGGLNVLTYIPHTDKINIDEYVTRLQRETREKSQQVAKFYAQRTNGWIFRRTGEEILRLSSLILRREYPNMLYPNLEQTESL